MYRNRSDQPDRLGPVCVVGAGSSGIAACQVLDARGIEFECFELGSEVGGNWRYENDNGKSAAYRSLHINTSRRMMAYATYPMPEDYPDYPSHFQIARYFDDYVDHFGLRDRIRFRTEVTAVEPDREGDGGGWTVRWRELADGGGEEGERSFATVIVANGHHWDARWPEPPFAGQDEFAGEQLHAHDYRTPDLLEGKRVLVLGIGNSACDIAVESSRIADRTVLAMRRSAWILPKYLNGKPTDELGNPLIDRLPITATRALLARQIRTAVGHPTDFGLPEPDHKLGEAHPTVSAELLPRLGHGDIVPKPNIAEFSGGREVRFADRSSEEIDLVIYCTGYKISFPFLEPGLISAPDNEMPLYRHVVSPEHDGIYFIGLVQPLGAIMPIAEAQSEWVADLLEGRTTLPGAAEMRTSIAADRERMARRYVRSKRHTIQVDFAPYMREIARERRRGDGAERGPLSALRERAARLVP